MFDYPSKDFKGRKIKLRFKENIEPQEILLDNLAKKEERKLGISERKIEVLLPKKILFCLYLVFLVLILILFAKTFQYQVFEGEKLSLLAKENNLKVLLIRPKRGVIYDRFGKQLVFNQSSFDLFVDKKDLPLDEREREIILTKVAEIIKKDLLLLKKEIEKSDNNLVLISENLDHQTLVSLKAKIISDQLPGLRLEEIERRNYLDGSTFSHLIGFTGRINKEELQKFENYSVADYIGKMGLEKSYEEILRGKPGIFQKVIDAYGNKKSEALISEPEAGKSLVLWLDSELQKKAEKELYSALNRIGSKKGSVVALDPKSGGVLAMVSIPNFDNNLFSKGISQSELEKILNDPLKPLFNRVISGGYPTGSTIKPLIAAAALEENLIDPEKFIYASGAIEVRHEYNPEIIYTFRDWKVHGKVNMKKAIADSCNVYFYTIGGGYKNQKGLGVWRIKKYLQLFGWGQLTQIDLPQETPGLIPDPHWKEREVKEKWYIGNTYHLSIGQGYLRASPLQVATAYSAIVNGGKLLRPKVVKEIIDTSSGSNKVIKKFEPEVIKENFIKPENLQIVREGMRESVTYGSSVVLNTLPVKAASKTGTAQTSREGYYHNWVTVFAPYEDPQIVLTIVIEDVKGMQAAVLPVAKNILQWYFLKNK